VGGRLELAVMSKSDPTPFNIPYYYGTCKFFLKFFWRVGKGSSRESQRGKPQPKGFTEGNKGNEGWGELCQKCKVVGNCTAEGAETALNGNWGNGLVSAAKRAVECSSEE
jgi:hypothetical protein